MGLLQTLGNGTGYLKAGFLGFPKSGKTWTATELAIGTRAHFGLDGPIAFFDTEAGSEYVAEIIRQRTGRDLVGIRSRAFSDLVSVAKECESSGISALLVDSVTHVWRELCDAWLKQVNAARAKRNLYPRQKLEFQDWAGLKAKWNEWTDLYLNSKLHIIIAGRAGFEYDFETNEETGKKELIKTGVKMRVESEFGFEPSLLVEMERMQVSHNGDSRIVHRATVIGDRFGVIDAMACDNPTFKFFEPHVARLRAGTHAPIDTTVKTNPGVSEDGDADWARERRERQILCEEIQGEIVRHFPGQTAEEKKSKADLLDEIFQTRSWTKVESTNSHQLKEGLLRIRAKFGQPPPAEHAEEPRATEDKATEEDYGSGEMRRICEEIGSCGSLDAIGTPAQWFQEWKTRIGLNCPLTEGEKEGLGTIVYRAWALAAINISGSTKDLDRVNELMKPVASKVRPNHQEEIVAAFNERAGSVSRRRKTA